MTGIDPPPPEPAPLPFPLIVGVTGHRDIAPEARQAIADAVGTLLQNLKQRFGADAVYVLSALAQGADQLVADAAVANGLKLIAILPMPLDDYRATMADDDAAIGKFEQLRKAAVLEFELPWVIPPGKSASDKLQYEQLGAVLSRYSHVLLALWDGTQRWETLNLTQREDSRGGTAHVVYLRAHAEREAEGFRYSRLFADADSRLDIARGGPAIQVVTPRIKTGSATADVARRATTAGDCIMLQVEASESHWINREQLADKGAPGEDNLEALFGKGGAIELRHIEQLNACIRRFGGRDHITHGKQVGFLCPRRATDLTGNAGAALNVMRHLQASADTAAQVYQRRLLGEWLPAVSPVQMLRNGLRAGWRGRHWPRIGALSLFAALVPATVALYEIYAHLRQPGWALTGYLLLLAVGVYFYQRHVAHGRWQDRFQDYRALAEAMRVQIFWALSAMPRAVSDHYMRMQRDELGWIQFALRGPALWAAALALTLPEPQRDLVNECWLDDQSVFFIGPHGTSGRADLNRRALQISETWSQRFLITGLALSGALGLLASVQYFLRYEGLLQSAEGTCGSWCDLDHVRDGLLVLIPTAPAIAASFAISAGRRAYEAHARSYLAMGRIFAQAKEEATRSACADDDGEYRRLIFDLGREALAENAAWLEDHRGRRIEPEQHLAEQHSGPEQD